LVATLLLAGWLAPALAVPRPDEETEFVREFLNALMAIFRVQDGRAVTSDHVEINVRGEEVIRAFGGADKVKEFIASRYAGSLGVDGNALAEQVVELLRKDLGRELDYGVERYYQGKLFIVIAEIKNEHITESPDKVAYAWKGALQDAYFVSAGRLGNNELLVWFIPASAAAKSEMKPLVSYLRENGIVVITDSEGHSVLKVLDSSFKARYGLDLIESVADWYGVASDAEVRAAFRRRWTAARSTTSSPTGRGRSRRAWTWRFRVSPRTPVWLSSSGIS